MNVDRYTKAMLTIIAGCLLWICVMGAGSALQAQRQRDREREPESVVGVDLREIKTMAQPVILVGTGTMDRQGNIQVAYGQNKLTNPTLSVKLPYSPEYPMAVEIAAVKKSGAWESLHTAVDDAPTRPKPGNGSVR